MRTYLIAGVLVWAIASAAFIGRRNREFMARELDAAARVAGGEEAQTRVILRGLVGPPVASARHPYLYKRSFTAPGTALRMLGGPSAPPDEKIIADAVTVAERSATRDEAHFLSDGSGRIVATRGEPGGTSVVLAEPTRAPAPFPWPLVVLLFAAGGAIVFAGCRFRVPVVGLALAIPALPAIWWSGHATHAIPIAVVAILAAAAEITGVLERARAGASRHRVAYTYLFPAALGMAVLVLAPFLIGCALGFYDHIHGQWQYVGLKNFAAILGGEGRSLTDPLNFWFTLGVTMLWTAANVVLHVGVGVVLALALRERWMKARGIFRVLLILPWAVPNYITALIWNGMFGEQYGAVNALLHAVGLPTVSWFSKFATSFCANVVTNTWLGFPFMMVVALGALESIPRDLYEAASVDGAGRWSRFAHITLPNLRPALVPAVVLGSVWTFNMFNVIYLVSGGKPAGATDILVTQAYRWAFERGQRYGMAAAYATLIFLILLGWTLIGNRLRKRRERPVLA